MDYMDPDVLCPPKRPTNLISLSLCRHCSNYIFILDLTPDFIGLGKDNCKTRRETFKFGDLVRLILEILRYWDGPQWIVAIYRRDIPFKLIFNWNLAKSCSFYHPVQLPNHFENVRRAWQWYCRAVCKILKRFDSRWISYGQMKFHKKWDLRWVLEGYLTLQQPTGSLVLLGLPGDCVMGASIDPGSIPPGHRLSHSLLA